LRWVVRPAPRSEWCIAVSLKIPIVFMRPCVRAYCRCKILVRLPAAAPFDMWKKLVSQGIGRPILWS
jgi:hypothetical protein